MIKIVVDSGEFCPVFICDYCGLRIDDARMGIYQWNGEMSTTKIWYFHKPCSREYERLNGRFDYWDELGYFLLYLLHNSGVSEKNIDEIKRRNLLFKNNEAR